MTNTSPQTTANGSELLIELVSSNIYRTNAFRLSGLPIDATTREIAKEVEKMEMHVKYGGNVKPVTGAFPLIPAPDSDSIREAVQRLRDPERRLIDELFWFFPHQLGQSKNDEALQSLAVGDTQRANQIWLSQEATSSQANVSMHNLAVFYHLNALDLEVGENSKQLSEEQKAIRDNYWEQALRRWKALLEDEAFWSRFNKRIKELDDPRLTTGTARKIRESLPLALLLINAELAVQAAEADRKQETQRHLNIINSSGFEKAIINETLRLSIEPLRNRIKTLCKSTKASEEEPEQAFQRVSQLIDETKPMMSTLDAVLPAEHPTREGAHDELALSALGEVIFFANKTKKWKPAGEKLDLILGLAGSASVRERINQNIEIFKSNVEYDLEFETCYYCKNQPPDPSSQVEIKMYGNVQRTYYQLTWKHLTVAIPRCNDCKKVHSSVENSWMIGCLGGVALGIGAYFLFSHWVACIVPIIVGAILGFIISEQRKPVGVLGYSSFAEFSQIKAMKALGWEIGEQPPAD